MRASDEGRTEPARREVRSALAVLEPQLARRPEDRETVLATVAAQLLAAQLQASSRDRMRTSCHRSSPVKVRA